MSSTRFDPEGSSLGRRLYSTYKYGIICLRAKIRIKGLYKITSHVTKYSVPERHINRASKRTSHLFYLQLAFTRSLPQGDLRAIETSATLTCAKVRQMYASYAMRRLVLRKYSFSSSSSSQFRAT